MKSEKEFEDLIAYSSARSFIISGSLSYETSKIDKGTFIKLDNIPEINFKVTESAKVFEIISPKKLSYKTYSNMRQF